VRRRLVEQVSVGGVEDDVGERRPVQQVGQVDEGAGDGRRRDPAPDRDVASVEVAACVRAEPFLAPPVPRDDDVDAVRVPGPDLM
jgi:hypothetical protein